MRTRIFALLTVLSICNNVDAYFQDKTLLALALEEGKTYLEVVLDDLDDRIEKIQAKQNPQFNEIWLLGYRRGQLTEAIKHAEENEGINEDTQEEIDAVIEKFDLILYPHVEIDGRV